MGTYTPRLGLYKPAIGERKWGTLVDGNADILEAAITALQDVTTEVNSDATVIATGSTAARSLASRFAEVVNVKDYGAVGDGNTDDTAAIQAAFNAILTAPLYSGRVIFPVGNYAVSSTLMHSPNNASYALELTGIAMGLDLGSQLIWTGAPGGTLLRVEGAMGTTIAHLGFHGYAAGHQLLYGIHFDSFANELGPPYGGTSQIVVDRCAFGMGTHADCAAVAVGHVHGGGDTNQVDTIAFQNCTFSGSKVGSAFRTLEGGNTKNFAFIGGTIINWDTGLILVPQSGIASVASCRDVTFLINNVDVKSGCGSLLIDCCRSEGAGYFIQGQYGANPIQVTVEDSYWAGTATDPNDVIMQVGGTCILRSNYFYNGRTGSSVPFIEMDNIRNDTGNSLGTLLSIGNFYQNADNTYAGCPLRNTNHNALLYVPGQFYEYISAPINVATLGDRGGILGAVVQLTNHWGLCGGPCLHNEYRLASTNNNGSKFQILPFVEELTIASAASTDSAFTIPAGAVIMGVSVRVTAEIPTASTFTVTAATGGTTFSTTTISTAAGSSDAGTAAGTLYTAAGTKVRITPNTQPAAATGKVRIAGYYYLASPPLS